jgi:hypothetical protein
MHMTAMPSAGTTLAISAGSPATFDETGFEALTFTTIGEITSIDGDVGRVYNVITHNPLATRATVKKKGSYNSGSVTIPLALDIDDAGQILAEAALTSDNSYSFKLVRNDATVRYFRGLVTAFPEGYGGVDAITVRNLTVEITADDSGNDFVGADS